MPEETTPEVTAPETPDWVEEKFRSHENPVEAQARSYSEASREMARIRTESERQQKEFTAALETLSAQEERQSQQQTYPDPLLNAAQRAYEEGDVQTLLMIQAQISQAATAQIIDQRLGQLDERFQGATAHDRELSLRLAEEQVQRVFGEERWQELAPKVQEALAIAPLPAQPSVEGYAAHLQNLAKIADYDRLTQQTAALEAERTAKLNAQTLEPGGRVQLTAPKDSDVWAEIKNADSGGWNKVIGG